MAVSPDDEANGNRRSRDLVLLEFRHAAPNEVRVQADLRAADEQVRQERAAARQRALEEQAAQEQEEVVPEPEPEEEAAPETPSVPSGNCSEVGITDFPVPPGDPRDRDGDGIACES